MRLAVATVVALLVYLLMNHLMLGHVADRWFERDAYKSAVYVLWIAAGFGLFYAVLLTARRAALFAVFIVALISVATNFAYTAISRRELSADVLAWMVHEVPTFTQAWAEFKLPIALAVGKALLLLGAFLLIRRIVKRERSVARFGVDKPWVRVAALAAFIGFHGIAVWIQPPTTMAETNLFVLGLPALFASEPDPGRVAAAPAETPSVEKIVLVIDESVNYAIYKAVIAASLSNRSAIDFGESASISNCSAPNNALLRWGIDLREIGKADYDARTNPHIWAFAKRAGFKTVLIDGQQGIGPAQNFMGAKERASIDEVIAAGGDMNTDRRLALQLNERLRAPGRELIYVIKRGSHFVYEMNYPADTAPADAGKGVRYATSVAYATGGFFSRLASDLPWSKILLVYTSDHGQDLQAISTHCNPNPEAAEYSVPLVVMTAAPAVRAPLAKAVPGMRNRTSHLNIFPTLLSAMGYERNWVESVYGPTLAGPPAPYLTFVNLGWRDRKIERVDFTRSEVFPGRKTTK